MPQRFWARPCLALFCYSAVYSAPSRCLGQTSYSPTSHPSEERQLPFFSALPSGSSVCPACPLLSAHLLNPYPSLRAFPPESPSQHPPTYAGLGVLLGALRSLTSQGFVHTVAFPSCLEATLSSPPPPGRTSQQRRSPVVVVAVFQIEVHYPHLRVRASHTQRQILGSSRKIRAGSFTWP